MFGFIQVRDRDSSSTNASLSATGISIFNHNLECDDDAMRKGNRPPPLNLSIVTRPRSLPRVSRTPVLLAKELTPLLTPLPEEEVEEDPQGPVVRAVRMSVDFLQIVSCMLVMLMLGIFLASYAGAASSSYGIRASILIAALACDVGLGIWSIRFYDRPWSGLAVVLRMLTAAVLVGSLVGFVAAGRVFPADYTYWNLASSQSGGPVLGLVSAILGWDLVHVLLSHRIVGCWLWMQCWWQRLRMRRRCMTAGARGRARKMVGGPWWSASRSRRTAAESKRGWSCSL
ncbi:hypothetical protein CDV36_011401 [Fusarium kuroshium]|uniref:Uncharacterized protein n=1 Tax=Fusarium kuroshium TaxID=2010991 RepID=A0A3M2RUL2_9HYPO|nr:hypothetical protein CDV36_011401 [Fusarium kuroshium]